MSSHKYCTECNNMLYPKEDSKNRRLLMACRNCDYFEQATEFRIFRNELLFHAAETAGVTTDVGTDPTLPRSKKKCPVCGEKEAVFFQSQAKRAETRMTLFYVCVHCGKIFEDTGI